MSLSTITQKKEIALAVETAVRKSKDVALAQTSKVGVSYPYAPDVPGVWVFGPDAEGRFVITVGIMVARVPIHAAADRLRVAILDELRVSGMADRIKSIDISVEDLMMAV